MKKRLLYMSLLSILISLVGCDSYSQAFKTYDAVAFVDENITLTEDERYYLYEARILNQSDFTIQDIHVEMQYANGQNAKVFTEDTLLPGDTSEVVSCIGPTSGELDDMSQTTVTFELIDDEMNCQTVVYHMATNTYEILSKHELIAINPSVLIDDLDVLLEVGYNQVDLLEQLVFLENNSKHVVSSVRFIYELPGGENVIFESGKTVNPEHRVQLDVISKYPLSRVKEMMLKEVYYTQTVEGESTRIHYNATLNKYLTH